jgi:membrane protein implicated in regulation of membrane protease activity
MRKITRRDWLALAVPAAAILVAGVISTQDRGWEAGLGGSALMLAFVVWLWRRQIRKHPEDTWRARI